MPTRRNVIALTAAGTVGLSLGATARARPAHARGPADPPPLPGATLTDLGSPMSSLTVVEGAFTTLPDGRLVAVAPAQGENSALNVSTVTDPATQVARHAMNGAGGGPTITVTADHKVYVGTYNSGHLFCWDPATDTMSDLGTPTDASTFLYGLSAAPDGTVHGGTYPDAKVWSYHPDRGFTDLGRVTDDPDVKYVKATAYDPDRHVLYASTRPVPTLWRKDLATGELTELVPAEPFVGSELADLDLVEGHLFATNDRRLRVFDTATDTEVDVIDGSTGAVTRSFSITGRGTSQARAGRVWFSTAGPDGTVLGCYDLATRTASATGHRTHYGALIGFQWTAEDDHDVLYGFAGNYLSGAFRYDLQADESKRYEFALSPAPSPLGNIAVSPDGSSVLINAFLNGNGVRRDVGSGEITDIARLGQVEDWTWVTSESRPSVVYAGIYPSGSLKEYRPDAPTSDGNPRTLVELKPEPVAQIRPHDVQVHDEVLWAASEPEYGQRGGALTTVTLADGEVTTTRPVVVDHTMCSLAFGDDRVYAGSSRNGGTGTDPIGGSAVLVEFDPADRVVLRTVTPVEGARSVNALTMHDGRLLGLADTTVFEVDPDTFAVGRTFPLPGVGGATGPGHGELTMHPNGYLYAQAQGVQFVMDALSFTEARRLTDAWVNRAALSVDGSIWTLIRPEGFSNPLHHGQLVPETDTAPDNRWLVHVRDRVTEVANRFVATGRTLADVAAEAYPADGPNDPGGEAELAELVATGRLTPDERIAISRAGRATR